MVEMDGIYSKRGQKDLYSDAKELPEIRKRHRNKGLISRILKQSVIISRKTVPVKGILQKNK